jgi:hypothetical protein
MRTKILAYSKTDPNKVVSRNEELEKINESVYTCLNDKSEFDEESDLLGIVIKIEDVYFEVETCVRRKFNRDDYGRYGTVYAAKFRQFVEDDIKNGSHVSILKVKVFEALDWDSRPLLEYREQRQARIDAERESERQKQALAAEQAAKEAAEKEKLWLEKVKADFIAGKNISSGDFVELCRLAGIPIPLRTHGSLNARIEMVNIDGTLYYTRIKGKRKPDPTGCYKLIRAYAETITGVKHKEKALP